MSTDEAVGYGRPPAKSRFEKGKSGNPKGRPKGSRNLKTLITEELDRPVQMREGGKTRSVRKSEALAKSLVNSSIQGDMRAFAAVLNASGGAEASQAAARSRLPMADEDYEIIANFLHRTREAPSVEVVIAALRETDT